MFFEHLIVIFTFYNMQIDKLKNETKTYKRT